MGHFYHRLRRYWNRRRFQWRERASHQALAIGFGTLFNVPVRGGGQGKLSIGGYNLFGYLDAPMLGRGEILLQARTPEAEIVIGNRNAFSNNISIVANGRIQIGDDCQVGDLVGIFDCDFHVLDPHRRTLGCGDILPVTLGNNVWLGSRSMVLKGVDIGDNSVVGAMSLVTKSIPPNSLAAGVPARVIRSLTASDQNPAAPGLAHPLGSSPSPSDPAE
jgi:maltose O-acetyltransferase